MPAYVIATVDDVADPDAIARYRDLAQAAVAKHGGKYIARGGDTAFLEGGWKPGRVVILEFPDLASIKTFYASEDYGKAIATRKGAATFRMVAVEGL